MTSKRISVLLAAVSAGFFVIGCPFTVVLPPEAALSGEWEGSTAEIELEVTFNSVGILTRVRGTTAGSGTVTFEVTGATTELDVDDVTITVPTDAGDVVFAATLSADQNTMTGTLSATLTFGTAPQITVPAGELTLTKVEDDDNTNDNDDNGNVNGNDNGNTNDNGNVNGNDNGNANDNGNTNDNGNVNGNDNTSPTGDATNGASLFSTNCQGCHGADAMGGFGPNIQGEDQAGIIARVRDGQGGHMMYDSLTDQDILDLEAYLASF